MTHSLRRENGHLKIHHSSTNRLLILLLLILLSLFFIACQHDDENTASVALSAKDIAYGTDPLQTMDIDLPAERTSKTKVIVFIHGGGWKEGAKEQFDGIRGKFVAQGFGTVSINYRHADIDQHISYVELLSDIDQSLLYLRTKSDEYVYNAGDICLFGHSAGAHLALLYAYRNNTHGQVTSVIALSAPTDLPELLDKGTFPSLLYNLVGSDDQNKFEDASPIAHVKPGAVPTFCFHGLADESVPYKQSQELYDQLAKWDDSKNELKLLEGEGHDFSTDALNEIVQESLLYLKK